MPDQLFAETQTAAAKKSRRVVQTVNPATGTPGRSYVAHGVGEAHAAAADARKAFEAWRHTSFDERAGVLRRGANILRRRMDELAALMTEEMGKTLDEGRAEVEKCAFQCEWFAGNAEAYLADEPIDVGRGEEFIVNENVRSDPRMPFGGVKQSGYGRECSAFGIREFVNIKSVLVRAVEGTNSG